MAGGEQIIAVIDDDKGARQALEALLIEHEFTVNSFDSAEQFLKGVEPEIYGCIILDIKMPGMSGLQLQSELIDRGMYTPIIFVTGHGKISWSVQAIKQGAINFLEKPYDEDQLLESIAEAFEQSNLNLRIKLNCPEVIRRYMTLSTREKEVVELLVYGDNEHTNKLIAQKMNISHRTVEEYRAQAMNKLEAASLRELVTMVIVCKLHI